MSKDKRVKGCYNLTCKNYRKEVKFKVTDNYCPNCGKELVFVCADCFEKIEDMGPEVKFCKECEAKKAAKKEKIKAGVDTAKKIAGKGVELAPAAIGLVKNPKAKNALKAGTNLLKKKKTGGI
jgi:hypothetical protein